MSSGSRSGELTEVIEDVVYRPGCVKEPDGSLRARLEGKDWSVRSWTDRPATNHSPHDHPYSHRALCVSGWIEFTAAGDTYRLEPGDALDLPEGVTHSARTSPDEPTTYWLLQSS